jgi:hypothetical protein|tara:strand:- start:138 stop:284 length:147 start_codon:yes stop_codon:yes gene_type:complete
MKGKIKNIIETAFTKKDAREMLETYRIFGNITEEEYRKGKDMIRKELE